MPGNDDQVRQAIEEEVGRPAPPAVVAAGEALRRRFGGVGAVLFYGSCRRGESYEAGVIDLYALVDSYGGAHARRLPRLFNALLPPSVYYLEVPFEGRAVRAKCAVMSLDDFARGASATSFHPYIWARFAQPCSLLWVRDAAVREAVVGALCGAVQTMIGRTLPLMSGEVTPRQIWLRAFGESYRAELRAERPGRAEALYEASSDYYRRVTGGEALVVAMPAAERLRARWSWRARRVLGKALSVARLVKAAFTFEGGARYILWKVERHSGVRVDVTPWQMRHPLLAAPVVFWRLYRRRAFR